jgi:hypothetical protein
VGAVDFQRGENGDSVGGARSQSAGTLIASLVAAPLAAMIREDQAELIPQRPSQPGRLSNFKRVREARVEEDRRSISTRVLEDTCGRDPGDLSRMALAQSLLLTGNLPAGNGMSAPARYWDRQLDLRLDHALATGVRPRPRPSRPSTRRAPCSSSCPRTPRTR